MSYPAKKELSDYENAQIIYFASPEARDKAYNALHSKFSSQLRHIEKRCVTNRQVLYKDWIVVDPRGYNDNLIFQEIDDTEEHQSVPYSVVLSDSERC